MIRLDFRKLVSDDLDHVHDIDRSESVERMYRQAGDDLEPYDDALELTSEAAFWEERLDDWKREVAAGASAFGAFDDDRMAGVAILKHNSKPGCDQIIALYVSAEYRLSGVAKSLYVEMEQSAKKAGAKLLYVLTTPTGSAVGFYLSQGFQPTSDRDLASDLSPRDEIPMVKKL